MHFNDKARWSGDGDNIDVAALCLFAVYFSFDYYQIAAKLTLYNHDTIYYKYHDNLIL